MITFKSQLLRWLLGIVVITYSTVSQAQTTYTSNGSGNFRAISWTPSTPADFNAISADNFIIRDGDAVTLASDISINNLEIGQGTSGSFTIGDDATGRSLTIGGNLTVLAGGSLSTASNSATHTVSVSGDLVHAGATFDFTAGTDVANLTVGNSTTSVISGNAITLNNLTLNGGGAKILTAALTVSGSFTADASGTDISTSVNHNFQGDFTLTNSATFTATSSTQFFNGGSAQALALSGGTASFNNVTFDNSTKTVTGNILSDGTFEITDDAIWSNDGGSHQIAQFEVKNAAGLTLSNANIDFTGGEIRFGDNVATDGTVTLGTAVDGSGTNVTFSGACSIERDDILAIDGDVTITATGYLVINGVTNGAPAGESDSELTVSGARTLTIEAGGDLFLRGYDNFPTGFTTYTLDLTSLVRYDADFDQLVMGENSANATINFGRLYLSQADASAQRTRTLFTGDDDLVVLGQMDLVNGVSFQATHTCNITFGEDLYVDSGTTAGDPVFNASGATVTFDSNRTVQVIDGPVSGSYEFEDLVITNTAVPTTVKTVNIDDNVSVGNSFSIQNTNGTEANNLIVDLDDNQILGGLATNENFTMGANTAIYSSTDDADGFADGFGDPGDVVTIDANTIVRFDRGGDQTIPNFNGGTFGTIQFAGSGNKYVSGNLDINGDVTRISGTPIFRFGTLLLGVLEVPASTSHTVAGDWNMATAYTGDDESNGGSADPMITFDGADQTISSSDFNDVTFSGTGTKTITGTQLIDDDVVINTGVTVNAGVEAIDVAGDWTENGTAVFTQSGSVTEFNGGVTQNITTGSNSYFDLVRVNNSSNLTLNSTIEMNDDLDVESGSTVTIEGQTVRVGGDVYARAGSTIAYTNAATSIIVMDGTTQQNLRNLNAQTYPTLQFEGVGNKELFNNAITIAGNLQIANESTFNANGNQINFQGDTWTNNGNFNHTNSVNFLNDGGTTTVSTSTFHDIDIGSSDGSVTTTVLLSGNITLDGELNIFANTTLDVSGSNYSITVEEDWNNYGTFAQQQGTVTFTGGTSDFRTVSGVANSGAQADKAFYDLTINLNSDAFFIVQEEGVVLNDQIDVLNNLRVESGDFRLQEDDGDVDPGPALLNIGGDFVITGGEISYRQDNAKITMNGTSGTHEIDLGGDQVRDFEINASGATYQLTNTFTMRDDVDNEFTLTAGTLDLNGNILTINRGGLDMTGGTLIVDEGSSLLINDLAADPDFNKTGGTLQIVGADGNPATFSSVDDDGFTFTQTSGDLQARYYTIATTSGEGLRLEGGTIDVGATGNDFSNGTFTSGLGTAYLTLANLAIGTISASNVIFNEGPTFNVAVDGANLPASGTIEFVIAGGTLAGAQDENDVPDGAATTGYIRWDEDPGLTWIGGTSSAWNDANNWSDPSDVDPDNIPDADDIVYIESGANNPVIGAGETYSVARMTIRSSGSLTFQSDGQLSVGGNVTIFSGCTVDMTDNASSRLNVAGAWSNAGTFNEGTATVTFNGTSGTHPITTLGNGDPFYNLTIDGDGATYTLGSVLTVTNAFTLSNGTFDTSSGLDIFINNNWTVNGGILNPGQGRVRFNGSTGTQSISGGTMWDVRFEGAGAKSIDGNISIADDVIFVSGTGSVSGNDNTIFIGGDWDLDETNAFVPGTGTVIFNGTATQNIETDNTHALTFNDIIFQNSGVKNFDEDATVNGNFSILSEDTFVDLEAGAAVTVTGTLYQTGGEFRIFDSNFPTAGAYSLTGGEVEFRQETAMTLPANITFNDVEIRAESTSTTATLTGNITVNDDLNLDDGAVTLDVAGFTITVGDNFWVETDETLTWNGGTLIHTGGDWFIDPQFNTSTRPMENVILNGTGLKRFQSDVAVNGNLTVGPGVELEQLTRAITNDGGDTFTMEAGAILDNRFVGLGVPSGFANYSLDETSLVIMQASGAQTIFTNSGALTYGDLDLFTVGTATLDGNLIVNGDFDMNGNSTLADANFSLTLNGATNDIQDYTPSASTTVTFSRAGDQVIQDNDGSGLNLEFQNVVFGGSGTKTLTPNAADEVTDIDGNLTINSGVTVTSTRGVQFSGSTFTNNGTFNLTVNSRPLVFDGGNATVDPGTNDIAALTVSNSTGTTVTIQNNGLDLGTGDMNISADAAIDFGGLTHQMTSENVNIDAAGSWILTGATLDFDQAGGQNIPIIDEANANVTGIPSIVISTSGTKVLTGNIEINNLTIGAGTDFDVSNGNDYQITVNGNWANNGGDFIDREGTVVFNSDDTDPKTINPNGEQFRAVTFQGTAVRTYTLQGDMIIEGTTAGTGLNLASATLDLNGNTLTLGNNDGGDPDAELNIIGNNGTLEVDAGATLQFETSDDGGDVADTEIGGNLDVQSGGNLTIVGTAVNVATVTRSAGGNRIDINIESGAEIEAQYYNIQYLTDEGLEVEDGATVNATNNFSNGTFSNLATDAGDGTGGDDNPVAGNRYLTIESDAALTINNVVFNFDGSPTIGEHYNVTRSNAGGNLTLDWNNTSGALGRSGSIYEDDGDATTPAESNGQLTWDLPNDTQWTGAVSTDWSNASNWDNGVPSISLNDREAVINLGQPFNPSIDGISVNISALIINDGILKVVNSSTFDLDGDMTLGDGTGGALIVDNSVSFNVEGSWTTAANAIFDNGDGTITFDANGGSAVSISPGDQSFYNLTFSNATTAGEFNIISTDLDVNNNLTIANSANVIPSSANYTYTVAGNVTSTGGTFDTSVDGEIILDGADQTLTDMSFDELTASGTGTKTTSGTTVINDDFAIESGVIFSGGGGITFNGDVTINGTFNGVTSQTYTFTGDDWRAAPSSYTGQGTVEFNRSTGAQYISQLTAGSNPVQFHNLTFSGSAFIELGRLIGGNQSDGNVDLTGNFTINNSINTFDAESYLVNNTSGTGTFTMASGEFITIRGANNFPSGFGTYALDDASTTRYWGTIDQTIRGGVEYGILDLNNSTTKTLEGNIDVDGDLTFRNSILDVSTNNYSINLAGRWDTNNGNDDGSFIARSGTVTFDGSASQTLDIGETGTQDFADVVVNKSGGNIEVATSNMTITGNINVFNGTFDANGLTVSIGGNMNASGTGTYTSGGGGLYLLNASSGTPTIGVNGSSIPGNVEINASGRTYELVDDLALLGSFTLTAGTLDVNGQTLSIGDFEDVVNIFGTLNVSTTAKPGGTLALGNDTQLVVNPGGSISIVGTPSQIATVTSTGTTDYLFSVTGTGGNPGTIAARYYLIEYVNVDGIYINANTTIDATNNFSDGSFQNGFSGGRYLRIENDQDLTGSNRIENIVFDDNPGGGAKNIFKTTSTTGSIELFDYSGGFSGESFDEDPNDLITWLDPPTVTWTGTASTDWFNTANWDSGAIPTSSQDVIIPQTLNEPIIGDNASVAVARNVTIEVNAVLKIATTDADAVDLQIAGDLTFEASSSFESSGSDDDIEIGGSWIRLSNAIVDPGTSQVTFNSADGAELIDNLNNFYNLVINIAGTATLSTDLTVSNDLTITAGTLDLSTSDVTVVGNFSNSGTINAQTRTVSLIPNNTTTRTFDPGTAEFYNLIIGETSGSVAEYDLSNDLIVNNDFDLVTGTLDPNTNDLYFGNSDATADNIDIFGTIVLEANETMFLGDDAVLTVQNGGELRFNGTNTSNVAALTRRTTGAYDFSVASGGTFEASNFLIEHMAGDGIYFQAGASLASLSSGTFANGSNASYYMRLSNSFVSDITATDITFNIGPANNIRRNEAAGNNIIFQDAQGSLAGATFELDDASATTGEIRWTYTNPLTVWTGGTSSDWNTAGNWDNGIPSNANTVQIPDVSPNPFPIIDNTSGDGDAASLTIFTGASLTINDNRTLTVVEELTNDGTLTITGTGSISVGDSWTNNGTFNPGNSTITLTSAADVTLSGGATFYNLAIDAAGTGAGIVFTSSALLNIDNDFTITDGVYNVVDASHNTNIGGNFTVDDTNGSFVDNVATVTFDGTTQNIGSASEAAVITFNNVVISGSGTKTVEDQLTINGDLSIGSGTTLALGSQSVSFAGSNFDVDGTLDVSGGTSTVTFNGSQIQVITGIVSEVDFDNFVVNNTASGNSDIQLNIDLNINDNTDFQNGVVQSSGSNPITFNDGATVSFDGVEETAPITFPGQDADGNSYVTGPVHKIGTADFIFPTGDGSRIARIGISGIAGTPAATDEYSAEYFLSQSPDFGGTLNGAIEKLSGLEYWDLSNVNGHSGQPLVTLFWDATSEVTDPSTLVVAHFNGASWDDEGNGSTTGNAASGSVTSASNWTSFSPTTLATTDINENPTPVELVEFTAKLIGHEVELNWSTASELNNDRFIIERSFDGLSFESIGEVLGNGTTSEFITYSFNDSNPLVGLNYYRLKQLDFDGQFEYSSIEVVTYSPDVKSLGASIIPNPTTPDNINISIETNDLINDINVILIDNSGRKLFDKAFNPVEFTNMISIEQNADITSGLYHVLILQAGEKRQMRLSVR